MAANKKKKKKEARGQGPEDQSRTISENRKARHRFEILEKIECGVVLVGSEVKSLREGKLSLDEAYVRFKGGEIWLVGADIAEYRQANVWNETNKDKSYQHTSHCNPIWNNLKTQINPCCSC